MGYYCVYPHLHGLDPTTVVVLSCEGGKNELSPRLDAIKAYGQLAVTYTGRNTET